MVWLRRFFMNDMAGLRRHWAAGSILGVASLALLAAAPGANAAPNLVVNGDFENNGGVGQIGSGTGFISLSNWTSTVIDDPSSGGYAFVVNANADSSGFPTAASTLLVLWGPGTPGGSSSNGFTGSPSGGSFLGISAGYGKSTVSQTITGLTPGTDYTLAFEYAGSQLTDGTGATNQAWNVKFGSQSQATPTMNIASEGFNGWNTFNYLFTATGASEVLEFTPSSTTGANNPFLLLDNVSLTEGAPPPPPAASVPGPMPLLGAGAAFSWSRRLRRRIHGVQ
jgi:MYXO-CTERM domain-containing protein